MKEWKRTIKLARYSYQFIGNLICTILFGSLGLVFMLFVHDDMTILGAVYILLAGQMIFQMYMNLGFAEVASASPKCKALFYDLPNVCQIVITVVSYIIVLVLYLLKGSWLEMDFAPQLVMVGFAYAFLNVYIVITYKKFWISILLIFVATFFVMTTPLLSVLLGLGELAVTIPEAITISLASTMAGVAVAILLRKAIYKLPIDKYALGMLSEMAKQ